MKNTYGDVNIGKIGNRTGLFRFFYTNFEKIGSFLGFCGKILAYEYIVLNINVPLDEYIP